MSDSIEKIVAEMRATIGSAWVSSATMSKLADRLDSLRQVPEGWVLVPREEQDALLDVVRESTYGSDLGREGRAKVALQNYTDAMANHTPPTSGECTRNCDCVGDCKQPDKATHAQAGAELPELRWLTRPGWDGPERVLQYKNRKDDWEDVPEAQ